MFLSDYNPKLVLLSETFWKPSFSPSFRNYHTVRRDRLIREGGGVAILVHKSMPFSSLSTPSTDKLETVGITAHFKHGPTAIISAYCPHGDAEDIDIKNLFDSATASCIIGGDFNGHHRLWKTGARPNKAGKALAAILEDRPDIQLLTPEANSFSIKLK